MSRVPDCELFHNSVAMLDASYAWRIAGPAGLLPVLLVPNATVSIAHTIPFVLELVAEMEGVAHGAADHVNTSNGEWMFRGGVKHVQFAKGLALGFAGAERPDHNSKVYCCPLNVSKYALRSQRLRHPYVPPSPIPLLCSNSTSRS